MSGHTPTTNLRHHPAATKIPLDSFGLTPRLFLTLSGCSCLFKLLLWSIKCHIHLKEIAVWTNSLFLNESVILYLRVNIFTLAGVDILWAIITEAVTEEPPLYSPYYNISLKFRSSRGRHSLGVSTGSSEARLRATRAYRAALPDRASCPLSYPRFDEPEYRRGIKLLR